jgi:hypothetical protein
MENAARPCVEGHPFKSGDQDLFFSSALLFRQAL